MKSPAFTTLAALVASVALQMPHAVAASSAPLRAVTSSSASSVALQRAILQEGAMPLSEAPTRASQTTSASAESRVEREQEEEEDEATAGVEPDEIDTRVTSQGTEGKVFIEFGDVKGETTKDKQKSESAASVASDVRTASEGQAKSKGNVDYGWKVEEGKATPGVEPDEIDARVDPEPITPDFSILLGGGESEEAQQVRDAAAETLLQEVQKKAEGSRPVESLSLNSDKIEMTVTDDAYLFGFIPISIPATVEIDAQGTAKVSFPFWGFLASGKDDEEIGEQSMTELGAVLIELRETFKKAFMVK